MGYISKMTAAGILGLASNTLLYRMERGELTPYSKDGSPWIEGKRVYFDEATILALKETPPEPDGREWLSVEDAAERLGMNRMSVFKLGREGKLVCRRTFGTRPRNGRKSFDFERESVEGYRQRMVSTPPPEQASEWMPIAEAMKALKMTRPGVKRRIKMGLLEKKHFGPPEQPSLYVNRKQVEEQVTERPHYARDTEWQALPATEAESAWCAGFFDGEGCVTIALVHGRTHVLQVSLSNSHEGAIRRMETMIGGRVHDRPRQKAHYRDQWRWQASGDEAEAILQRLLPYLIVKAPQAALGIEFQEATRDKQNGRWGPISPEEQQWRADQKEKISRLNRPNVPRE